MQIDMKQPILDKNDKLAQSNRDLFKEKKVFVLDLLASPGSGKTSTILATIEALRDEFNIAVIEGDIASSVDSEKIKQQGIAAVQINTGGACHLESDMIRRAVDVLDLDNLDLIIIENVGNLVCPTDFDLGENMKAMILSVPEGTTSPQVPRRLPSRLGHRLEQGRYAPGVHLRQGAFLRPHQELESHCPHLPPLRHQRRRRRCLGRMARREDSGAVRPLHIAFESRRQGGFLSSWTRSLTYEAGRGGRGGGLGARFAVASGEKSDCALEGAQRDHEGERA